ncbi:hypothetical protein BH11ARM2_BH11ARM2_06660 [soil metagenome]
MKINVEITVCRRVSSFLGLRQSWENEAFSWSADGVTPGAAELAPDLSLFVERSNGTIVVGAYVEDVPTHLLHTKEGTSAAREISFEPVNGVLIKGKIEILADATPQKSETPSPEARAPMPEFNIAQPAPKTNLITFR